MCVTACPSQTNDENRYITFTNNSNRIIGYQFSFDKVSNLAQDTFFHCNMTTGGFINSDSVFILECPNRVNGWESDLNNSYYIQFLIMDGDKFTQHYREPCDSVRKYVPILYCYRLKLEDLQRMNWTVVYPPEE